MASDKNTREETFSFKMERPEVIIYDQHELFEESQGGRQELQHGDGLAHNEGGLEMKGRGCSCKEDFRHYMGEMRQKMNELFNRVSVIENTNADFRAKH
jgi:hypothetical protein